MKNNSKNESNEPQVKARVFMTYWHKDSEIAYKIKDFLTFKGIQVKFDRESLMAGGDILKYSQEQISAADFVLIVVSQYSLISGWISHDINYARSINANIIPVRIDHAVFDDNFIIKANNQIDNQIEDLEGKFERVQIFQVKISLKFFGKSEKKVATHWQLCVIAS